MANNNKSGRTQANTDRHGRTPAGAVEELIPKHGGYRNTKTWQLADLIYDITVLFCDKFVDSRSRTHDQMVQAARSGVQNLQEGSVDSATSKKIEIKLTGIAKGSLKELQRDYQKFLQHRNLSEWPPGHPALVRLKARRCATLEQFRTWVAEEARLAKRAGSAANAQNHTDEHGQTRAPGEGLCVSVRPTAVLPGKSDGAVLAANGVLTLLNLCIYLVGRQLEAQAVAFEKEGGFTERLYRVRQAKRIVA